MPENTQQAVTSQDTPINVPSRLNLVERTKWKLLHNPKIKMFVFPTPVGTGINTLSDILEEHPATEILGVGVFFENDAYGICICSNECRAYTHF